MGPVNINLIAKTMQYLHISRVHESKFRFTHVKYDRHSQRNEAESDVVIMLTATALRQARRDRQLVSKRLLLNEDEDQPEVNMDTASGEQVRQMS